MKNIKRVLTAVLAAAMILTGTSLEGLASQQETLQSAQVQQYRIEYVQIEECVEETDNSRQVVIGMEGDGEIQNAELQYHNTETGEGFQQFYTEVIDGAVCFELPLEEEDGNWQLDAITFEAEGKLYTESFLETGMDVEFGENEETAKEQEAVEQNSLTTTGDQVFYGSTRSSELVIVLDPGHDDSHAGAHKNGLEEETLNLKIALYCKEALEEYYGVKVYLTRDEDGSCPYPGRTAARCNEKRVDYAKSVGADILISLHNNSSTSSQPNGAMVFYPNKNYNSAASTEGKGLASKVQDQLVALGLSDQGISVRYSADYTYPDGSTADYYAMIRNSKLVGIPAIIVEHAFLSNSRDAQKFLSSDGKLKALAEADVKAIVSYYGLSKEAPVTPTPTPTPTPVLEMESLQKPAKKEIFSDVYTDWYTDYVTYVYQNGIMNGITGTTLFEPNGKVTKAQVAQVLYNMEGKPKVTDRKACTELKDVYEDWFTDAVCWAYNAGIVTGNLMTQEFSPNASVKREELALMLYRYANYIKYTTDQTSSFTGLLNADKVSEWASAGMKWAVGTGVITGIEVKDSAGKVTGYDLKPQGTATRAQLAAILMRFCQAYD